MHDFPDVHPLPQLPSTFRPDNPLLFAPVGVFDNHPRFTKVTQHHIVLSFSNTTNHCNRFNPPALNRYINVLLPRFIDGILLPIVDLQALKTFAIPPIEHPVIPPFQCGGFIRKLKRHVRMRVHVPEHERNQDDVQHSL